MAVINKDCRGNPIRSPVAGLFIVNTGGSRGGYNAGIDIIGDAVVSCDMRVVSGSTPSLRLTWSLRMEDDMREQKSYRQRSTKQLPSVATD